MRVLQVGSVSAVIPVDTDSPSVRFATTGKYWQVLRQYFPDILSKVGSWLLYIVAHDFVTLCLSSRLMEAYWYSFLIAK